MTPVQRMPDNITFIGNLIILSCIVPILYRQIVFGTGLFGLIFLIFAHYRLSNAKQHYLLKTFSLSAAYISKKLLSSYDVGGMPVTVRTNPTRRPSVNTRWCHPPPYCHKHCPPPLSSNGVSLSIFLQAFFAALWKRFWTPVWVENKLLSEVTVDFWIETQQIVNTRVSLAYRLVWASSSRLDIA